MYFIFMYYQIIKPVIACYQLQILLFDGKKSEKIMCNIIYS